MEPFLFLLRAHLEKAINDNQALTPVDRLEMRRELDDTLSEANDYIVATRAQFRMLDERLQAAESDKKDAGHLQYSTARRMGYLEQTGTTLRNRVGDVERTLKGLGLSIIVAPAPDWQVRMFDTEEDGDGNRR
jgi:hypothetical protein